MKLRSTYYLPVNTYYYSKAAVFFLIAGIYLWNEKDRMKYLWVAWIILLQFPFWLFNYNYLYMPVMAFYLMLSTLLLKTDEWGFEKTGSWKKHAGTALFAILAAIMGLNSYSHMSVISEGSIHYREHYREMAERIHSAHPGAADGTCFLIALPEEIVDGHIRNSLFSYTFKIPLMKLYAKEKEIDVKVVKGKMKKSKYLLIRLPVWMEYDEARIRDVDREYAERYVE